MGSSIGISRVKDAGGLEPALDLVRRYDEYVIIEEADRRPGAGDRGAGLARPAGLGPGEIKPSHEFYDFEDKYLDGAAGLEVPARLPDGVAEEMGRIAIAACQALRVDSMARVDFFFEEGGRGLLVNEVNTIPGFTPISMYPRMWAASGSPTVNWSTSSSIRLFAERIAGRASRLTAPDGLTGRVLHAREHRRSAREPGAECQAVHQDVRKPLVHVARSGP